VAGVAAARVDDVQNVRVVSRSASGRVARLGIALEREEVEVDGPSVRQVLRTVSGDILRSTAFTLDVSRDRGRVTRVVAEGTGNGHGVGFCQWGAVGRARSGQDFQRILAAYYPETQLSRLY